VSGVKTASLGRQCTGIEHGFSYRTIQFLKSLRSLTSGRNRTPVSVTDGGWRIVKIQNHKSEIEHSAWGCSSVGRAVALQAIGQEFESPQLHQPDPTFEILNFFEFEILVRACSSVG
jgi:hypothetical protein